MASSHGALARYPRHTLIACGSCGDVFINWTTTGTVCRACGSTSVRELAAREPRV